MMELLSPAGTFDALRAAVQNGADAVYLGADRFSARAHAGNFDNAGLEKALEYAHVRGVRLYLTLNTLLTDAELPAAMDVAAFACRAGFDAIIVQDIGLAAKLAQELPIPIHASTQMTIHNASGMTFAHDVGIRRVVLARELSLTEIGALHRDDMEIEVFAHGALCVCWSGQCLMSSMIGGRSGNRGNCAQPCRLPWRVQDKDAGYALSMRDLMALELLPQLQIAKVTSLKLEGRMKSPEYVAVATGIYRKYLDLLEKDGPDGYRVAPEDIKTMKQLFSRGGFTSRYLTTSAHRPGAQLVDASHQKHLGLPIGQVEAVDGMHARVTLLEDITHGDGVEVHDRKGEMPSTIVTDIKTGGSSVRTARHQSSAKKGEQVWIGDFRLQPQVGAVVYRTSQKVMLDAARATYEKDDRRLVPLNLTFRMAVDELPQLVLQDSNGNSVTVSGEFPCELARKVPLEEKRIEEQLCKMGGSAFVVRKLDIQTDAKATLPVSELNRMRRAAVDELTLRRAHAQARICSVGAQHETDQTKRMHELTTPKPIMKRKIGLQFAALPNVSDANIHLGADRWLIPVQTLLDDVGIENLTSLRAVYHGELLLTIPAVLREADVMKILSALDAHPTLFDGCSVGQVGLLQQLAQRFPEKQMLADVGCNVWNQETLTVLTDAGACGAVVSPESIQTRFDAPVLPLTVIAYGHVQVMTLEHCPGSTVVACNGKCDRCSAATGTMTDRAGATFPYRRDAHLGRTIIFQNKPIRLTSLSEYSSESLQELRLMMLDETANDISKLIQEVQQL